MHAPIPLAAIFPAVQHPLRASERERKRRDGSGPTPTAIMKYSSLLGAVLLALSFRSAAAQQIPKSQLGVVTQWIAGTKVEIVYRRPVARGRALFGALVPYGRTWTPSADSAARFSTSGPIEVNGARLEAGTYSLWAIPGDTSWTMSFNSRAVAFHIPAPSSGDVLSVRATPTTSAAHVETLLFAFPMTDADSARLELAWGSTVVPFTIKALAGR